MRSRARPPEVLLDAACLLLRVTTGVLVLADRVAAGDEEAVETAAAVADLLTGGATTR